MVKHTNNHNLIFFNIKNTSKSYNYNNSKVFNRNKFNNRNSNISNNKHQNKY